MATTLASQVQELYVGYLGRAADKAGLDFWVKAIENGTSTLESVALGFTLSEEYKAQYNGLTTTQLVAKVYQNVLGRAADADGLAFWAGEVNKGVIKADTLVKSMINSLGAIDQLTIDNKVAAANAYTIAAGDKYNVEAGKAAVVNAGATVPGTSNPGQTFTLTDKVGENVVGTAADDTFKAVLGTGVAADSTLNIGDSINGAAGVDTLELILSGAGNLVALPAGSAITNIEKVFLTHTDNANTVTGAALGSSATYAGIKELWQVDNDVAAVGAFGNVIVAADVTAGFKSTGATATAVAAVNTVTAASGTQTVLSAALDGVATASNLTFAGAGVKTVNVAGTVAAAAVGNAGDLTVTGTATVETLKLSMTSAVDLTLATFGAGLKTIDASATTGAIRANGTDGAAIATTANLETVKLGSAGDNVAFNLALATKALAIDAGAGNDRITLDGTIANDNGDVTVTLGAGKDVLVIANTLQNLGAGVTTVAELTERMIKVTDFKTAEDVLDLSGAGGVALTSQQLSTIAGSADLLAAVTAVDALVGTGSAVFSFGGDAYVFSSTGAGLAANDALVQLVGVDATQFTNIQNGNLVI